MYLPDQAISYGLKEFFMQKFAVITGASKGLGKAFAQELARRKINLILISLPEENLKQFGLQLKSTHPIEVICFETDVTHTDKIVAITKEINENYQVFFLINNVGVGGSKKITEVELSYITTIIKTNIKATAVFTHQLLANLMNQDQSYILNISSLAALTPLPYKTVYPASKAFIRFFSKSLNLELKDTNTSVSLANLGPMPTNDDAKGRIDQHGFIGRLTLISPMDAARECVTKTFKRKKVININRLSWLTLKIVPDWIKIPILTRAMKNDL